MRSQTKVIKSSRHDKQVQRLKAKTLPLHHHVHAFFIDLGFNFGDLECLNSFTCNVSQSLSLKPIVVLHLYCMHRAQMPMMYNIFYLREELAWSTHVSRTLTLLCLLVIYAKKH